MDIVDTLTVSNEQNAESCAIYYVPEAYEGDKRNVVGRQSAGSGFLDALIEHGGQETMRCIVDSSRTHEEFKKRVAAVDARMTTKMVSAGDYGQMREAGCLFTPGPLVADSAWTRRYSVGERCHSICGITHSIATERVIRSIRDLMLAPTQAWDALICTSPAVRDATDKVIEIWNEYLESRGMKSIRPPVQLPVIPLGVNLEKFSRTDEALEKGRQLRQRLGIAPEDIVVLHFGRFDFRSKLHPSPVFRSMELARCIYRKSRLHLLMVGQFSDQATAANFQAAQRLYCSDLPVHWIDGADIPAAQASWTAADIFISLSDNVQESFGMTPVEAMAAQLPGVVSDWDGYKSTVIDGDTGFRIPTLMAPPGAGIDLADAHARGAIDHYAFIAHVSQSTAIDIDVCAARIAHLAQDGDLRRRMGEAAHQRARSVYDWRIVIQSYRELWRELSELRAHVPALSERRRDQETVHPDYPDLFRMFGAYPTATLTDDMLVEWADADAFTALRRSRMIPMDQYSLPVMLDHGATDGLVALLERGPRSVGEIARICGITDMKRLNRTLVRLYKFGVLKINIQ
ncbi:glycosyl transferase, group 1 (plasmid) [Azospirillum sp. B510]|nr:glycosyl transferase, group 1 [Azospirillum sp. B510]